ncbi:membrane bound O-acyl transferase family-domain-containing protein, partial [Pseudomassariella vexata]
GLVVPLGTHALCLRAMMSIIWIWNTNALLKISHNLSAIFFVFVLQWDQPAEWPALFGSLAEAYSLRRFWGVFWHRLHVKPFEAYMPPFLRRYLEQEQGEGQWRILNSSLKALWIFLLSAGCHSLTDWVLIRKNTSRENFRFFLTNYVLCLAETVV